MGRGRLRRGYSLEVIFEEDPDFCSHLDSLDSLSVAIRFGVKEADDTISVDSLVEEYEFRVQGRAHKEQVFRSLDGVWDVKEMDRSSFLDSDWDEFSLDSNTKMPPGAESFGPSDKHGETTGLLDGTMILQDAEEVPPTGRRSRVSRRQIVEASWMFESESSSSSSDSCTNSNTIDDHDMQSNNSGSEDKDATPEPQIEPVFIHNPNTNFNNNSSLPTEPEPDYPTSSLTSSTTTTSTVINMNDRGDKFMTTPTISLDNADFNMDMDPFGGDDNGIVLTGPSLVTCIEVEDFKPGLKLQFPLGPRQGGVGGTREQSPPNPIFGQSRLLDVGDDKDTLDSYISTRTDDNDNNAYNFADPFDDTQSVASTNFESSSESTASSTGSVGSVCTVNGRSSNSSSASSSVSSSPQRRIDPQSKFRTDLTLELESKFQSNNQLRRLNSEPVASSSPTMAPTCNANAKSPLKSPTLNRIASAPDSSSAISSMSTDLRRVRALFEGGNHHNNNQGSTNLSDHITSSRKSSLGEESNAGSTISSNSSSGSNSGRIYSKNNQQTSSPTSSPTTSSGCGVVKRLKQFTQGQSSSQQGQQGINRVLRSAYSQFNLNQTGGDGSGMDFAELLVNDNVVIEDSPDLFQTLRNRRRDTSSSKVTLTSRSLGGCTTLRRSKSMGTGISGVGSGSSSSSSSSRSSILAEEMPAPDTVKNVRTVFEQMLKIRASVPNSPGIDRHNSSPASGTSSTINNSSSFSIIKKSLSSVKSNPTSKIYRSESMRDDFPVSSSLFSPFATPCNNGNASNNGPGRRYGKPILMSETGTVSPTPHQKNEATITISTLTRNKNHPVVERKFSEPIKFSPKINSPVRGKDFELSRGSSTSGYDLTQPLTEEDLSLLSSLGECENPPKRVSPDVLQRIRSCGTTTTYFGGEIVAQTVNNRKLPLTRRHTMMGCEEFSSPSEYSPSPNGSRRSIGTTPTPTKFLKNEESDEDDHANRNEDVIDGLITKTNNSPDEKTPEKPLKRVVESPSSRGRVFPMDLDSVFAGLLSSRGIDTTPRIISVVPKSPSSSGSPTKSISPVGSIIGEGRNTPEGCESHDHEKCNIWINEIPVEDYMGGVHVLHKENLLPLVVKDANQEEPDGNNNDIGNCNTDKRISVANISGDIVKVDPKFSTVSVEGAWF